MKKIIENRLLKKITELNLNFQLFKKREPIVVAVSGGSDSLALLTLLHKIPMQLNLTAVYVDHNLRPEEVIKEKKSLTNICKQYNIPFQICIADVPRFQKQQKMSTEEAARILRYQLLERARVLTNSTSIAVGHTADDQVEEFFLRLFRGTGRRGLSGMRVQSGRIIRPLLFEKKEALEQLLRENNLPFCFDSSNRDKTFLRNRVRLELLPLLEQSYSPSIRNSVLQGMDIIQVEDNYLHEQTEQAYRLCVATENDQNDGRKTLYIDDLSHFCTFHKALQRRVLEKCCWQYNLTPNYAQIDTAISLIGSKRKTGEIHLGRGLRFEKISKKLVIGKPLPSGQIRGSSPQAPAYSYLIAQPGVYHIEEIDKTLVLEEKKREDYEKLSKPEADFLWLDSSLFQFPLQLRLPLPGERFTPCNGPGRKKITRYLQNRKISKHQRYRWPVLVSADNIIAIPGIQLNHCCRVTKNSEQLLRIFWKT